MGDAPSLSQYRRDSVLYMTSLRRWIDWSVLALCIAAAAGAVVYGVGVGLHGRPAPGALAVIAGLTIIDCGFLIGAAVCQARGVIQVKLG